MATPRISKPSLRYFSCKSTSHGISILQGSHHVAQKLTITALPLMEESETSLPSSVLSVKSGATVPLAGPSSCGLSTDAITDDPPLPPLVYDLPTNNATVMTTMMTRIKSKLRFMIVASERKFIEKSQIA